MAIVKKKFHVGLRNYYYLILQSTLAFVLLVLIIATSINWQTEAVDLGEATTQELVQAETVELTVQIEKPPAPARPQIPIEVPDDSIIEDDDIQIDEFSMGTALSLPKPPVKEEEDDDTPFVVVEQQAKAIGGTQALQKKVKFTELATRNNIEGRIVAQFIVNRQGRVEDIKILKGLPGGLNEEVIRVLKESRWRPARQRGKAVRQVLSMPFVFQLRY